MISYGDVNCDNNYKLKFKLSISISRRCVFYNLLIHLSNINKLSIHAINGTQ